MTAKVIQLSTPEDRAKAVAAYLHATEPKVEIRSIEDALSYGDNWRRAYRELQDDLEWKILDLRSLLLIEQSERLLERIEAQDEIARLRKLATP